VAHIDVGAILAIETEIDEDLIERASTAASQDPPSDIVRCVEVVRFRVMEEVYGPEDEQVRLWPGKLRDFARGDYPPPEIAGLDSSWLGTAPELANRIDQWRVEDRDDAIALVRGEGAEALFAVLGQTYSDGWDSQQVSALYDALRAYLGL
jgi:hypothetical protein